MDLQVSELILTHHRIAYIKTDIRLSIVEAGGSMELLQFLGFKRPEIRAANAERPGQGAFFTFKSSDPFNNLNLREIIPSIEEHKEQFLNVLHGLVAKVENKALTISNGERAMQCTINLQTVAETDRSGRIVGLIHLVEDISDIEAVRQEKKVIRQRVEMLQNQLDMVAHELGTPLTLVSGYLELLNELADDTLSSEQRQCMELIEGNVDNLHIVVKSLFDIVFAEADGLRLALQPINIVQLLQSSIREFESQLATKSQNIILKASSGYPNALCDNTRIIQVINNLLSNASKFSPIGSTIEIDVTSDTKDKLLQIGITDNGSRIANEEKQAIFDRFYRTKFGKRAESQGAGLGLYLCRQIIQMHGGQIWCQASTDMGSTFCFTLPSTDLPIVGRENGSAPNLSTGTLATV
ncbi:MAG: ATP-binding protein [Chloroflexota bacterium]